METWNSHDSVEDSTDSETCLLHTNPTRRIGGSPEAKQAQELMKIQVLQHSNAKDYGLHSARSGSDLFSPRSSPIEKDRFYDPMVLLSVPPGPTGEVSLNTQQHCPHVSSQKIPAKRSLESAGKCFSHQIAAPSPHSQHF